MNEEPNAPPPLKITVVTPNYNCGAFLEDTILSVVSQNYPNLEYILVDGDSTDDSMRIVERYAHHFAHIICEKDQGHADALNKGFKLATGEVLAWINSDDLLLPGSLHLVNQVFSSFPEVAWLTGRHSSTNESGQLDPPRRLRMWSWIRFLCGDFRYIQQESTFWRRALWQAAGARLDTRYQLANDFELWLRFFQRAAVYTIDAPLGCFRFRNGQRSIAHAADYENECEQALGAFVDAIPATLLARHFHLMSSEQLRSRRVRPTALPSGLSATDTPVIAIDSTTGNLTVASFVNRDIPFEFKPEVSSEEDMIFDGFDRVVWSSGGPQFSKHDLTAVELDLVPFAPNVAVPGGLSDVSPPMVALIGPLAISDWGSGKMTLHIRFQDGAVSHDLQLPEAGRRYRVKLILSADRYTLILDGHTLAVENTKGTQVMQSPFVVLGGGHAQRFWVGAVQNLAVTVMAREQIGNGGEAPLTYLLTHQSGTQALPRQRRAQLPPVKASATNFAQRASPLSAFRNLHLGQRCFVMGNGPSLNKMDLDKLAGEVVFACNGAFLLFDRVSWRPTYYTCVDTRVIRDRAVEITQMLDTHPSITAFLPSVVHLHDGSGAEYSGREIIPPGANRYYFNEVSNRESHHVETMFTLDADDYVVQPYTVAITMLQLAAFMGFSEIYLIGCDTSYKVHETVKQEGRQIDGVCLLLTSTRDDDSNHFDPRYFGKGREWHNPQVSKMIDHYRWAQLAVRRSNTRIFNATVGGQLEVFPRVDFNSLFPARTSMPLSVAPAVAQRKIPLLSVAIPAYESVLGEPLLGSVFVPTNAREIEVILANFRLWASRDHRPTFDAYDADRAKPDLVFIFNNAPAPEMLDQIRDEYTKYGMDRYFAGLHCESLDLTGEHDLYERDYTKPVGEHGYKSGPNNQFFGALRLMPKYGRYAFLMETDCVPVRNGWLSRLQKIIAGTEPFWVMGSQYRGVDRLDKAFARHLNGNALYAAGDPDFQAFVTTFWEYHTRRLVRDQNKRLAYDCILEIMFSEEILEPSIYQVWRSCAHQFRYTDYIQDISGKQDLAATDETTIDALRRDSPDTFLLHNRKAHQLVVAKLDLVLTPIAQLGAPPIAPSDARRIPRLLMIDSTPVGHTSATGQLKQTFLGDWPKESFLQIWESGGKKSVLHAIELGESIESSQTTPLSPDAIVEKVRAFQPDVIYFRPIDSENIFDIAERIVAAINKPLVIHMMDDWPERLRLSDAHKSSKLDAALRRFAARATKHLSICDAMSATYKVRYGGDWLPLANGVDPTEFPAKDWTKRAPVSLTNPFVIRYMGGLADDMTYASVKDIALAVSSLQEQCPIRFEIHTMDWYRPKAEQDFGKLPGASVNSLVEEQNYRRFLSETDALVIAYNFDAKSIGYIGLSLANKMPECLVTGVPLLAYGPPEVATIDYLKKAGCALVVDSRNKESLRTAIQTLVTQPDHFRQLGVSARAFVAKNLTKNMVQQKFRDAMILAKGSTIIAAQPCVGPFERQQSAHYDETNCVAVLYSEILSGQVMIHVGAHFGSALAPFLDKGWDIYAFEPDEKNRIKLLERLATHKNKAHVTLDTRCVSNKSQSGVSFYRSEQSTGISGLSAFDESHVEAQRVDTIALTEFFQDKPLPPVDFLKIDTEGHDLFVLQGFPWDRGLPAVIECEFEDTKTVPLGYTFHDLARFLVDKGYTVYVSEWHPIIRYGIRHNWNRLVRYPSDLADEKGWGNLLAFREPIDENDLVAAVHKVLKVGVGETAKPAALPAKVGVSVAPTVSAESATVASAQIGVQSLKIVPGSHFTQLSANQWRYIHSDAPQKLWLAVFEVTGSTDGRSFVAGIHLKSSRAMTVNVSIGRHASTDYEGAGTRITLAPGSAQSVQVRKEFAKPHIALKVQVEVLELAGGGTADLTIDLIYLNETLASIRRRVAEHDLNLRVANRLFREGDYAAAMGLYLLLHQQRPLKMYPDNALMAARKLGMDSVRTVDDLLQRVS